VPQKGECRADPLSWGCLGIGKERARRVEGATRFLQSVAHGEEDAAAGLADGFYKFLVGVEPPMDGATVQPRGGSRGADGGTLGQGDDDLCLERRKAPMVRKIRMQEATYSAMTVAWRMPRRGRTFVR